ncbi:sigma-54-dependent transcriptional regulator [Clostridium tunisiense]|uniref:sigma-54-dependent transcriptional regulator n=1 Tax=Clostridium tunisiense TaxID=219748 RepID=UPI00031E920B|nr:sigma 54-interacting transcriptional regulator [Clostridium tunisiense]
MKHLEIYNALQSLCNNHQNGSGKIKGFTAEEVAKLMNMKRPNVVREFAKLINEGLMEKATGRPVLYYVKNYNKPSVERINEALLLEDSVFNSITGKELSLKHCITLAKAAIIYPPRGLHCLIAGETGVGKSFFAKTMFKYALQTRVIKDNNRFSVFNCADYANTPQLLVSQIFGVKKGAFTGATEDREGIIEKARDGILFLDEVHRLPPEGQEMLFTLMDEGYYSPLGSTKQVAINLMIICATTENINSSLLRTFTRRIPVTIVLPPLRERSVEERLELIQNFLGEESKRVGKKIEVQGDALTALINYDCFNNIGELKSDIQIACAKAFLRSMFSHGNVKVHMEDFSQKVKAGLLKAKKVSNMDSSLKFSNNEELTMGDMEEKYKLSKNIYEFIDSRSEFLKSYGLEQIDIKGKLSDEVEDFINRYVASIKDKHEFKEIKSMIDNNIYDLLSNFIYVAEYRLKRKIRKNTFIGLLIHIDAFLNRAKVKGIIENPKIDEVRKKYPEEFKLAMILADKLQEKFNIVVPLEEIGFITMFFAADGKEVQKRVTVILAMHGNSTATSMAEVVNELLNTNHVIGFDMPLSMKPEEALQSIEKIIVENHEGMGVLLMVDMGSLKFFNTIIRKNTGIEVITVDMVTTSMVIEATRKAIMNKELQHIVKELSPNTKVIECQDKEEVKKSVIITACSTGEGTAQKLKEFIYKNFTGEKYEVINLGIKDEEKFQEAIEQLKKEANIKAVVSPFKITIPGITYIPMDKFFREFMDADFQDYISDESLLENMKTIYKDYLNLKDSEYMVNTLIQLITKIKYTFDIHLDSEKLNGLLMHWGALIQRLIEREETYKCKNLQTVLKRYGELFEVIRRGVMELEAKVNITFSDEDIGNIIEILVNL